jgi:hypothetical protein
MFYTGILTELINIVFSFNIVRNNLFYHAALSAIYRTRIKIPLIISSVYSLDNHLGSFKEFCAMNSSVFMRASASEYWTGGDFMK